MKKQIILCLYFLIIFTLTNTKGFSQACVGVAEFTVTINNAPLQPDNIAGNNTPCIGEAVYSVSSVSGITYNWTASGGTIVSGQGTNIVTVNWNSAGEQTLTVTPSNGCGNGTSRTLSASVAAIPDQPSLIVGNTFACNTDLPSVYSIENTIGVTYTWSISGGGILTPSGNTATVEWSIAGDYILTVIPSNVCGDGAARTLDVSVEFTPTPVIDGNSTVCSTQQQTYSVEFNAGSTYLWSVSANGTIISVQGTNTIVVEWDSGTTGNVSVTETRE